MGLFDLIEDTFDSACDAVINTVDVATDLIVGEVDTDKIKQLARDGLTAVEIATITSLGVDVIDKVLE